MAMDFELDTTIPTEEMMRLAIDDPNSFDQLIEILAGESRRKRQYAAGVVLALTREQPELMVPCIEQLTDALYRPEAQTRWQVLEALSILTAYDIDSMDAALEGAASALYDEDSSFVQLAAVRFLCAYGAHDAKRSEKVWTYLDEAIQCYHGDLAYQDMLDCVIAFSQGKISSKVRAALADRVRFDAENASGPLGRRTRAILENCSK